MQKPVEFWWVGSLPNGELKWVKVYGPTTEKPPPDALEAAVHATVGDRETHGNLRVENDYLIMRVFTGDQAAHEKVDSAFSDAAALAQEWMLPPAMPYVLVMTHGDKLAHIASKDDTGMTLCRKDVRRLVNTSQAAKCGECVQRAGPAGLVLG